jgi:hypothetical protein
MWFCDCDGTVKDDFVACLAGIDEAERSGGWHCKDANMDGGLVNGEWSDMWTSASTTLQECEVSTIPAFKAVENNGIR